MPARSEIAAIDALVSSTAAAWSNGRPVRLRVSSRKIVAQRIVVRCFGHLKKFSRKGAKTQSEKASFDLRRALRETNLNHSRHDLADAALEFAVVGDGRAHRDVGGIDWRNAECDELGGVDQ